MSTNVNRYAVVNTTNNRLYLASDLNDAKDKLQQIVELTTAMVENKYQKYVDYPNNRAYTYDILHNYDLNKTHGVVSVIEHCEAYDKRLDMPVRIKAHNKFVETIRFCIMEVCKLE